MCRQPSGKGERAAQGTALCPGRLGALFLVAPAPRAPRWCAAAWRVALPTAPARRTAPPMQRIDTKSGVLRSLRKLRLLKTTILCNSCKGRGARASLPSLLSRSGIARALHPPPQCAALTVLLAPAPGDSAPALLFLGVVGAPADSGAGIYSTFHLTPSL